MYIYLFLFFKQGNGKQSVSLYGNVLNNEKNNKAIVQHRFILSTT